MLRSEPAFEMRDGARYPAVHSERTLDLRLFSTVTTVGAPRDITVQELRIECFIPADDASEHALELLAQTLD